VSAKTKETKRNYMENKNHNTIPQDNIKHAMLRIPIPAFTQGRESVRKHNSEQRKNVELSA